MRLSSPVPKKHARIEIIPLIDIMFFLLASFMMVSLSQTHMKGIRVNLPAAVGPPPSGVKDFVSIKVLEGNAVFFDNVYVPDDQVMPRLFQLHRANKDIKISISAQPMAMYGDVIGVLDKVRSVGITKVGYQIRAAGGVTQTGPAAPAPPPPPAALVAEFKPSKSVGERANGFGAMADGVLHFVGQFTESLFESFRNENRVVAESGVASCFIGDSSFHYSFEGSEEIAVTRERYDTAKSSTTPIICGANSRKLAKQFIDFVSVRRVRARVTRRINSRCTAESVNLQSRIVSNHQSWQVS